MAVQTETQLQARLRASIPKSDAIWVGGRVTLVVDLLAQGTFSSAPAFDLPQTQGVIVFPPESRPVIGTETEGDITWTTQRHELAVYAQRAGTIEIPAFNIRFETSAGFGQPVAEQHLTTPAVSFIAKLPPGAEGLAALVTTRKLKVSDVWTPQPKADPQKIGTAFIRTITIEAHDVPGMLLPAVQFDAPDGIGVYLKPPAVEDHSERGDLTGRRVATATYICQEPGKYDLPAQVLVWWNPEKNVLNRTELPGRSIEVAAASAGDAAAPPMTAESHFGRWIAGLALLVVALIAAVLWLKPILAARRSMRLHSAAAEEVATFNSLAEACRNGNPVAAYTALFRWLDCVFVNDPAPTLAGLAAQAADSRLTAELTELDTLICGRGAERTIPWDGSELLRRLGDVRSRIHRSPRRRQNRHSPLPPLNPIVPVQAKIKEFFSDFDKFPYQVGSSLNAAGINYGFIRQQDALKRLKDLESLKPQ
jgi:hypothetical protein